MKTIIPNSPLLVTSARMATFLALFFALFPTLLSSQNPEISEIPAGMVTIKGGSFLMGSEGACFNESPVHRVSLDSFLIDRYEVSVEKFCAFIRQAKYYEKFGGNWFRFSLEGTIDLLTHFERKFHTPSIRKAQKLFAKNREKQSLAMRVSIRQVMVDLIRWRSAVASFHEILGREESNSFTKFRDSSLLAFGVSPYRDDPLIRQLIQKQKRLPVRGVTWHDAFNYAKFYNKRLPTEAEWEFAARSSKGYLYPWGMKWDRRKCHAGFAPEIGPVPIDSLSQGKSLSGCFHMAGNVWEWTADWYGEFYYRTLAKQAGVAVHNPKGPEGPKAGQMYPALIASKTDLLRTGIQGRETTTRKVVRGGGYSGTLFGKAKYNSRATTRLAWNPNYYSMATGFRCVKELR